MDGFLLDCYPEAGKPQMVLWLKADSGKAVAVRETFVPAFYVRSRRGRDDLSRLAGSLEAMPGVSDMTLERHRLGLSEGHEEVLAVRVRRHEAIPEIATAVDRLGGFFDYDLFDVDLRMSQRYLFAKGLFPFARMRAFVPGRYRLRDAQWATEYAVPELTRLELSAEVAKRGPVPTLESRLLGARVGEEALAGDEEAVLRGIASIVRRRDPDLLLTDGGDGFLLPYIHHRARLLGMNDWHLGREPASRPVRRGRSFFTYGRVKYSPPAFPLAGRIHLDRQASFFWGEGGLRGLIDLARISGIPLQELARLEAGSAVTAIQIDRAKREGRLIPWKKNHPEEPKTLRQLARSDRGGMILDPVVGIHDDVFELDFSSLYPAIIATRNLSPETVLCTCCDPANAGHPIDRIVPQIGYHVCRREGLVPRALGELVKRRGLLKAERRQHPERSAELTPRIDALKWLCVVSFGYQGYRNARFGRIECHEATTAWGREILLTAAEIARLEGFEFLHGIVDSLWIKRFRNGASVERLAEAVSREIGIDFEPQGRYKWIVFLPTREGLPTLGGQSSPQTPQIAGGAAPRSPPTPGALNRYYGCFESPPGIPNRSQAGQDLDYLAGGALKVRGVELRQSSACRFVVRVQEAVLNALAPAEDGAGFRARIPTALDAAFALLETLRSAGVPAQELLIAARISQPVHEYRQRTLAWSALRQLAERGVEVRPGEVTRYLVTRSSSSKHRERVREARLWNGEAYDRAYYEELAVRAVESLLLPAGLDRRALRARLAPEHAAQTSLG